MHIFSYPIPLLGHPIRTIELQSYNKLSKSTGEKTQKQAFDTEEEGSDDFLMPFKYWHHF